VDCQLVYSENMQVIYKIFYN